MIDQQVPAYPEPPGRTRRQMLKGAAVLAGAVGLVGAGVWAYRRPDRGPVDVPPAGSDPWLDTLAENVVTGNPQRDGIPPIDKPQFVAPGQMSLLDDDDPVFGLVRGGQARAYPQLVLVWHEIVNDRFGGEPLSVTYCPLTGSAFAVRGEAAGKPLTFGTTGQLVNSNLLMYDRQTDSEWPQLATVAIRGRLRGQRLTTVPMVWATWGRWRRAHPDTTVLSTETGHLRDYGLDPYGSYTPPDGYYVARDLLFPVLAESDRLAAKEVVIGVRKGDDVAAIVKDRVARHKRVSFALGDTPLAAVWDDRLASARVVRHDGRAATGVDFFDVMWFAWHAFYPDAIVIQ
ncbi:MAG: DUF3179 domain-containing protein [Micromonosporaceae bacterium]